MSIGRNVNTKSVKTTKAQRSEDCANIRHYNAGGFQQATSILNFTDKPLYVKTQGNVPFVLMPIRGKIQGSISQPHVEIKTTCAVKTNQDFSETLQLANQILVEKIPTSLEAKKLFAKIQSNIESEAVISRHYGIEDSNYFMVMESDILADGYSFIRECNLVLSFDRSVVFEHHPNSNESWTAPDIRDYDEARQSAGNMIRIIDNDNLRDKWYYFSAKQVVEVTASQDRTKDSGVYFTKLLYENGANRIETEYMTFSEAEERLGLHTTKEAAITNGNPEHLITAEETRYKVQLEKARREIELLKQEAEQQRTRHDIEISRIKFDAAVKKERIEMSSTERKDELEEKSAKRKDSFDKKEKKRKNKADKLSFGIKAAEFGMKAVPLIAGVVAVGLGYAAGRNRNDTKLAHGIYDPQDYGIEGVDLKALQIATGAFVDPIYDTTIKGKQSDTVFRRIDCR